MNEDKKADRAKNIRVIFSETGQVKFLSPTIANDVHMQKSMGFKIAPDLKTTAGKLSTAQFKEKLANCKTSNEVDALQESYPDWDDAMYDDRRNEIANQNKK